MSWNTANDAVLEDGRRVLLADPARFDGVRVLGVDEHAWRHTPRGDKYVTVIIDLAPVRARSGPARLLDMVEGRSKSAFAAWLAARPQAWRDGIEVVAMDGFTGFKTAAVEAMPGTVTVLEHLRGSALGFRNVTNYIARCLFEGGGFSGCSRRPTAVAGARTSGPR